MKLAQDLLSSFSFPALLLAAWFAPVALIYKVAKSAHKNTSFVLLGGLLLGWLGAAVVALILPRQSDAEFAALHSRQQARATGTPLSLTGIVLVGVGVCSLILVAGLVFISQI